jgi:hypothetical protein
MPKTTAASHFDDYAPVADRIVVFYQQFPSGRIVTELVGNTEREVVFKALVFRSSDDVQPAATGWASERVGDGEVNSVACLENTETSAIGRALANLGLTASRNRPSREEMEKVNRVRSQALLASVRSRVDASSAPASRHVSERPRHASDAALQAFADRVLDLLQLLRSAERSGFPEERALRIRADVNGADVSPGMVENAERELRRWFTERTDALLGSAYHPESSGAARQDEAE